MSHTLSAMDSAARPALDHSAHNRDWEYLLRTLDDLELQAEGLYLADREFATADLSVSHYAEVTLLGRLRASVGEQIVVRLAGLTLRGVVRSVGTGWVLVAAGAAESLVMVDAIDSVQGLAEQAIVEAAVPVIGRIKPPSALRRLARTGEMVVVILTEGTQLRGRLGRVGADFAELIGEANAEGNAKTPSAEPVVVRLCSVALVRRGPG